MLEHQRLLFHPNVNTKTLAIEYQDFIRFIKYIHHNYQILSMK